jgi:acyl-CoA synthetase (NDP forming)/GNAT superfamily N-acetyltransferase
MSVSPAAEGPTSDPDAYAADVLLSDGQIAHFRSVRLTDLRGLQELHERANSDKIYHRFFTGRRRAAQQFVTRVCDPGSPVRALVATVNGRIVGLATAEPIRDDESELSLFVDDRMHGVGLGTLLLEHMAGWQREHGIETFVADVLAVNAPMLAVFRDAGFAVSSRSNLNIVTLRLSTDANNNLIDAADYRERVAERASLQRIFEPQSVVVVGVSRSRGKIGRETLENIRSSGFKGSLYAISPHRLRIKGVRSCRELAAIPEPIDLVIVAVPPVDAVVAVREAAAAGAKGCVVITSGFSEAGQRGREQQGEMLAAARAGGMRLIGPNCFGLISQLRATRLNATFSTVRPPAGTFAFASQSGGVGIAALNEATTRGVGLAAFVSLGNKADVSGNDLIAAWTEDPAVAVGGLYLESFGNPRKFARLARGFSARKPLLCVFGGASEAGHRAGMSHTAASASSSATVRALFDNAGVVGVSSVEELVDAAALFTSQPLPAGPGLAILSNAGGIGILAADSAQTHGLDVPELPISTQTDIQRAAPGAAGCSNPVDLGAAAGPAAFASAALALTRSSVVDALLVVVGATAVTDVDGVIDALDAALSPEGTVPVLLVVIGGQAPRPDRFPSVDRAVRALGHALRYAKWRARSRVDEPATDRDTGRDARVEAAHALEEYGTPCWLPPREAAALLDAFEIEVPPWDVVKTPADAVRAAESMGYPVVAKVSAPDIVHKSDLGLVATRLAGAAAVDSAVRRIVSTTDKLSPILIQKQSAPGTELAVGVVRDTDFGPLIMIATGGVNLDVWSDQVFLMPPFSEREAQEAVRSLRSWPLLCGHRAEPPGDVDSFIQLIVNVARLAVNVPELCELDLNPVIVTPEGVSCVDVKMRLQAASPDTPVGAPALSQGVS